MEFTDTQKNRLVQLGIGEKICKKTFSDDSERNREYAFLEKSAVRENRNALKNFLTDGHKPELLKLQRRLEDALHNEGFSQVTTPQIIPTKFLHKMNVTDENALYEQVFHLNNKTCLRPMLAPNLYDLSKNLLNIADLPLRIFEIGSCFRKESEGKSHLEEFTMLNLVEWGTPLEKRADRICKLAKIVMDAAEINDWKIENENSIVYGEGLDIVSSQGLELASSSMGPHVLDSAWGITSSWVGIGIGLERLLMHKYSTSGIHRYAKSIAYLNGSRLNIK